VTQEKTMTTELVGDRGIVMTRMFSAPRRLVFKAYSDCDHLNQWWGPRLWPLSYCDLDFRPGGTWHYCMRGPNGEEAWGKAIYREIVEPEQIVYMDAFSDAEGTIVPPESVVTVRFEERAEKTLLTIRTEFASAADRETVIKMGVEEGMAETLDQLEEHLATL
jgi:uncharacterized protein YndB with AHSA1/START domain